MRSKIKAIVLYSFSTLALIMVLNAYVASSFMYQRKTTQIDTLYQSLLMSSRSGRPDEALTVVIGNSYVGRSFQADPTRLNALKFTVGGMLLVDILAVVENLPDNVAIESLVVGLGYNYANPVKGASSLYDKHITSNPVRRAWTSIPLVRGHSFSSAIIKEDLRCISAQRSFAICHGSGPEEAVEDIANTDIGADSAEAHLKDLQQSTKQRYAEYEPFVTSVNDSLEEYLLRLQDACDKRGIRLFAYTAPIYKELRALLDPTVIHQFREAINDTGIDYVDMNQIYPDWDGHYFMDATHVDPTIGGTLTTDYLITHIGG